MLFDFRKSQFGFTLASREPTQYLALPVQIAELFSVVIDSKCFSCNAHVCRVGCSSPSPPFSRGKYIVFLLIGSVCLSFQRYLNVCFSIDVAAHLGIGMIVAVNHISERAFAFNRCTFPLSDRLLYFRFCSF